jgi:hypothetical protein
MRKEDEEDKDEDVEVQKEELFFWLDASMNQ